MKEFFGQYGGRTLFNEDLEALRELGLSFHHIFEDFGGNFVISGCEVSISRTSTSITTQISSGYVWLDGKIRAVASSYFTDYDGPLYISPKNTDGKSIHYATRGVSGFMSRNYGTAVTNSVPSSSYIACTVNDNSNSIINKFYDKYVITKGSNKQTVNSKINILKDLYVKNAVIGNDTSASFSIDENCRLVISISQNNMLKYKYIISDGISAYDANDNLVMEFRSGSSTNIELPNMQATSINYSTIKANNVKFNGIDLYNSLYHKYIVDWTSLQYTDGTDVGTLSAKRVDLRISICGTIPLNDKKLSIISGPFPSNSNLRSYITNIKLPQSIPSPQAGEFFPIRGGGKTDENVCYYLRFGSTDRRLYIDVYSKKGGGGVADFLPSPISINWNYYFV